MRRSGPVSVEAEVFGIYAVHESIDCVRDPDDNWRVTHVPSGMCLRASSMTRDEAIAVARLLSERLPDLTLQTCTPENSYIAESCFAEALS